MATPPVPLTGASMQADIRTAMAAVLGTQSQTLLPLMENQIIALARTGRYIQEHAASVDAATLDLMLKNHADAIAGVMQGLGGIGQTIIQQAVDSAINAVITAVNAAKVLGFVISPI